MAAGSERRVIVFTGSSRRRQLLKEGRSFASRTSATMLTSRLCEVRYRRRDLLPKDENFHHENPDLPKDPYLGQRSYPNTVSRPEPHSVRDLVTHGLNVHSNLLLLIRDGGKWGDGYLCPTTYSLHCHHRNDSRAGSCVRLFNVSLIVWAVRKQCP